MKNLFTGAASAHVPIALILLLFLGLGLARVNDLSLYSDSSRYVIWGNSLAHGRGFVDDTQPTPEYYVVNAPLYAAFLAPALVIFPMSLIAAKVWTLLLGGGALFLFFRWVSRMISPAVALAGTFLLAVNPLMIVISTEVLSESSFLLVLFGALLMAERMEGEESIPTRKLVGLVALLSIVMLLREAGVALVLGFTAYFVLRKRYVAAMSIFGSAALLFGLWTLRNTVWIEVPIDSQQPNLNFVFGHFVTSPDASLLQEMVQRVWINVKGYYANAGGLLFHLFPFNLIVAPGGLFVMLTKVLAFVNPFAALLIGLFSVLGIVDDFRASKTASMRLMILALYLGVILTYPVQDLRFQLPLLPLLLYYILRAVRWIGVLFSRRTGRSATAAGVVVLAIVVFPNLVCLYEAARTNLTYRSSPSTMWESQQPGAASGNYFSTPWSEMGLKIQNRFEPGTVIASSDKEIVPFAPAMKFLELNRGVPLPMMETLLRTNGANYVLAAVSYGDVKTFQVTLAPSRRFRLEPIEIIAGLTLYRIHARLLENDSSVRVQSFTLDLDRAGDLMRLGQLSLHAQRYGEALALFRKARERFRQQSEITFSILMAHALGGDSVEAVLELQRLYASPSATSFIPPARLALHAMNEMRRVRALPAGENRSDGFHRVAAMLWSLGYGGEAYKVERELLAQDSTHFVGLLWACNWGLQQGDTVQAGKYLRSLRGIDSANAVVRSFLAMARHHDALRRAKSGTERSSIHLSLAKEYNGVELPEEAFDAAERALAAQPSSAAASEFYAELKSKRMRK